METMIADHVFRESLGGRQWRCKNRSCLKTNPAGKFDCDGCNSSMPPELFGKDLVFRRFKSVRASEDVKLLKFVLKHLPFVEEGQNLVSLIDAEAQKMSIETQMDGQKQEKLLKFKEKIEVYSKNEGRSVFNQLANLGGKASEKHFSNKKL